MRLLLHAPSYFFKIFEVDCYFSMCKKKSYCSMNPVSKWDNCVPDWFTLWSLQSIYQGAKYFVLLFRQNEFVSVCMFFDHRAIYVYFYWILSFVKVNIDGSVFWKNIQTMVWRLVLPKLPDDARTRTRPGPCSKIPPSHTVSSEIFRSLSVPQKQDRRYMHDLKKIFKWQKYRSGRCNFTIFIDFW